MTPEHRDKQQEALARHFIQIPMEIFFDKALTSTDKIIYGRINTFDEFFESNGRTADILGICEKQVRRSKKHLLDLGYIKLGHNDGRGKSYIANEAKLHDIRRAIADEIKRCQGVEIGQETCEHGVPIWSDDERTFCPSERTFCPEKRTICPPENKVEEKENKKEKLTKEKTESDQPQQFGNPDINALLDAWAEATGFDYKNQKMERYAMAGLLKTHGLDATKSLISRVKLARRSGDRFAPQIAKPSQLRGKYSKFEALTMWAERREAEQSSTPAPMVPKNPDYFYENPDAYDTGETREEIHERCEKLREKYGFGPRKELD